MERSALLLAPKPLDRVTGLVTWSQQLLKALGEIENGRSTGVDNVGSAYSQI